MKVKCQNSLIKLQIGEESLLIPYKISQNKDNTWKQTQEKKPNKELPSDCLTDLGQHSVENYPQQMPAYCQCLSHDKFKVTRPYFSIGLGFLATKFLLLYIVL